jgi:hypothetical protein
MDRKKNTTSPYPAEFRERAVAKPVAIVMYVRSATRHPPAGG